MSRVAGIHVIAATGRPEPDQLTAGLRASLPARLCFKLATKAQSRLVINDGGAELLLGAGDLLFGIGGAPVRGQAPMLGERDAHTIAEAIRRQGAPNYEPSIRLTSKVALPVLDTETYQQAVSMTIHQGSTSVSELRSRLGVQYSVANDLLGRMQAAGLLADQDDDVGRRPVRLGRTPVAQFAS
jgi:DNA segregation ATPase FtsK/SpoIIIE, S-DNA-T family